jgi:hypothetical protein
MCCPPKTSRIFKAQTIVSISPGTRNIGNMYGNPAAYRNTDKLQVFSNLLEKLSWQPF